MTLAQVLSAYINLNLLIIVGFFGLLTFSVFAKKLKIFASVLELKLHYIVTIIILFLSLLHPLLPKNQMFSPTAKVWSAESIDNFTQQYTPVDNGGYLSLATPIGTSTVRSNDISIIWATIAAALLLLGCIVMVRDIGALLRIQRRSFLIRQLGSVRIFANESIHVPFSFWLPGQANVVIPTSLLERRKDYSMALAHEMQHHRHCDTRFVYLMWALKVICIINPFIHLWNRWIMEVQEFACDEALVDQGRVESQLYARCLVEVAQTAIHQKHVPVCATGLAFLIERNLLNRRISRMLSKSKTNVGKPALISTGVFLALILGATSFASKSLVHDRRVDMSQAKAMAKRAQNESPFPIMVNELVLKQLNRYIGTPEGRENMRDSLARMENYKALISESMKKYGVPNEIMALPIIESGFQNLSEEKNSTKSAGLWQFIPSTARVYGLKVDSKTDERLDAVLATDAALRYLQSNNLRFRDWHLSILAYNMGEKAVQKGIDATGKKDAWHLIRNGHEGDKDYLAKLMAAILIMRNPESVR